MANLDEVTITLADGTTFSAHVNGNNYLSETEVTDAMLTDEKLKKVTIDGVKYTSMHCTNHFKDGDGDHIILHKMTENEIAMKAMEQAMQDLILAQMGGNN